MYGGGGICFDNGDSMEIKTRSVWSSFGRTLLCGFLLHLLPGWSWAAEVRPSEARVYLFDKCVASDRSAHPAGVGVVASILIPKVLDAGLTAFGTWLENMGKEQTTPIVASQRADLYRVSTTAVGRQTTPNPHLGCIIFVRGHFNDTTKPDDRGPRAITIRDGKLPEDLTDAEVLARLRASGISLDATPDVLLETAVHSSEDKTAWYLVTDYYRVSSFVSASSRSPSRGLALTVTLEAPAVGGATATTHSAFILNYGDRKAMPGRLLGNSVGRGAESNLQFVPPLREQSAAALATVDAYRGQVDKALASHEEARTKQLAINAALDRKLAATSGDEKTKLQGQLDAGKKELESINTRVAALRDAKGSAAYTTYPTLMPVTVRATLTETEDEKKFLLFLAGVFKASKDELSKAAAAELSPAKRATQDAQDEKAASDLLTTVNTAERNYWQAQFDLDIAKQKLAAATDDLALQKTVKLAEFNVAETKRQLNMLLAQVGRAPIS